MRHVLILAAVLATSILLAPGLALADDCPDVCTSSTPCDTECGWDPGKGGPVTCAEYGVCDEGGGSCTPNYQIVSSTAIGGFPVFYYSPTSCDYVLVVEYTWHDVNNCPGSSDYTSCGYATHASRPDHQCCTYYWCGGQTSC